MNLCFFLLHIKITFLKCRFKCKKKQKNILDTNLVTIGHNEKQKTILEQRCQMQDLRTQNINNFHKMAKFSKHILLHMHTEFDFHSGLEDKLDNNIIKANNIEHTLRFIRLVKNDFM